MRSVLAITRIRLRPAAGEAALLAALASASLAARADDSAPLARDLADPLSASDHLALQLDCDEQLGGFDEGQRRTVTGRSHFAFVPAGGSRVVWRLELPYIRQQGLPLAGSTDPDASGGGDLSTSFLYVPAALRDRAFQWGIGLAARLPTASRDGLGQEDGALGPAVAARWVGKRWSSGLQLLHEQALGGEGTADVTRVQPFVVRDLGAAWSMGAEADARYDWEHRSLKGPLTVYLRRARGTWAFAAGARYWPDGPTPEPEWGLRIGATWVFE